MGGQEPDDSTGDPAVDEALAPLHNLGQMPTDQHVTVYSSLHEKLLAELDADVDD